MPLFLFILLAPLSLLQVAPSGNGWHSEKLPDSSRPERAHTLPCRRQHGVLPHIRGLLVRLSARGGRCIDPWDLCVRAQLPATFTQSRRSTLHLHLRLEGPAGDPGEGKRFEPGAEGGQEEEAPRVVRQLPSADEREVHRGHRGDSLQKWLTVVLKHKQGISYNIDMV